MTDCVLLDHIAATGKRFLRDTGKPPKTLALGRWDARELAKAVHRVAAPTPEGAQRPSVFLRACRGGLSVSCFGPFDVEVKVDGRIGRMPGALWWHP